MRRGVFALLCATVACQAEPVAVMVEVTTPTPHGWAGSWLRFESASFAGPDTWPLFFAGSQQLTAERRGDAAAVALLPDTNGWIELRVVTAVGETTVPVHVYGFAAARSGPDVRGAPYPASEGGEPTALITENGQVKVYNYRTRIARVLTATTGWNTCQFIPVVVPSLMDPTQVAAANGCGPAVTLPITAGGMTPDSGPAFGELMLHLARGRWLMYAKFPGFSVAVRQPDGSYVSTVVPSAGNLAPRGVAVSTQSGRIVTTAWDIRAGGPAPVFDLSGAVAYRLPEASVLGAAFSPDGDSLFFVGADSVRSVRAATGIPLRSAAIRPFNGYGFFEADLAVDPAGGWLFVAGSRNGEGIVVDVFDRATLAPVTTLHVPGAVLAAFPGVGANSLYRMIADGARRRLYLTANSNPQTSVIFEFDLLP